ncbi:MAG: WYL domain-containing protein [Cytophagales bacterium]|jgi:predicted DNA-binding transcriptional regulator YafY/ectoine hydroxylase-related dioxygenase (phytanoyl-CoA dioxygenase family)|nr:WYL domain-containing protein [Cytophagales bacterium]MCA6386959.1 WYL domain-containing protein [Cytophagales bacterium]MCA6392266.1 WYL domain-containing protein [Cytophagales bacterium]MCA6394522.1 WYL domain-containing protein [Cytophagales bacterium]MCA6399633.1 WYL domain-containing protein [Cytophagales bacterium]
MPLNRNALVRFRTIDNCLRNRQRRWTLEALIEACSEALYEYEGIDKGVSRRSVQMDLQLMRSDKLGYNAPIIVLEKKYYTYEDPDYSITNIPLTNQDLGKLTEVVEILRQFKGFSHFQELSGMVQRLENKIYSAKTKQEPVIDFEKNENLKGLEYIETLYQSIIQKKAIEMCYQSFKAKSANEFTFHPYYLKEYRNRWFVLGVKNRNSSVLTLALDRIASIKESIVKYIATKDFNVNEYFQQVIGVTVEANGRAEEVVLFADRETAPYILTKPIHQSQIILDTQPNGVTFSIRVQLNFELEREILGFGDRVKVLAPEKLKRRIKEKFEQALDLYQYEFNNSAFPQVLKKLEHKGFAILHHVYSRKEVNQLKELIYHHFKQFPDKETYAIRDLFGEISAVKDVVLNNNLRTILKKITPQLFLTKAIYFDKSPENNWYVSWHQDITINVKDKIETTGFIGWTKKEDYYGVCPPDAFLKKTLTVRIHLDDTDEENGALKVLAGSQNKKLTNEEIQLITQNSVPYVCDIEACGVQLMRPLLIHASSKATSQKHRRVIHLEFNSEELPNRLEWAEKYRIQ